MNLSDRSKTFAAVGFFTLSIIGSISGVIAAVLNWMGLINFDAIYSLGFGLVAFIVFFILGILFLLRVKDLSWINVSLPFIFSVLFSITPDFIPLQFDDAAAVTVGAIFSFMLSLKKNPNTPKWVFVPLLAAGVYTIFGGVIPGPVDEFIVDFGALLIALYGAQSTNSDDIIDITPSEESSHPELPPHNR